MMIAAITFRLFPGVTGTYQSYELDHNVYALFVKGQQILNNFVLVPLEFVDTHPAK